MPVNYTFNQVSIANFIDKTEIENEDCIQVKYIDNSFVCFVLCDGAGGAGIFSKEWAQFLAEKTPPIPFKINESSKIWFYETAKDFHDTVILHKNLSDLMLNKKVYRDGSYSTFCACWIDIQYEILSCSAIGDTFLFFFQKYYDDFVIKEIDPIQIQQNIDDSPELLNWNSDQQTIIPTKVFKLDGDSIIIIASDSLAKWILINILLLDPMALLEMGANQYYLNSLSVEKYMVRKESIARGSGMKSINDLLFYLKENSMETNKFRDSMKELYQNEEIDIDDYSLIYIENNVSN